MKQRSILSVACVAALSSLAQAQTFEYGDDCNNLTDQLCGSNCAKCSWSWPSGDPDTWASNDAACRCQYENGSVPPSPSPSPSSGFPPISVQYNDAETTLYVVHPSWSDVSVTGDEMSFDFNNRMYLSNVPQADSSEYFTVNLLGGAMEFDVDLSQVGCGCVTALYTVTMPAVDNGDTFKYCDANQVGGHWCPEFDIMEANQYAFHVTGHKCDAPDANGVFYNCDRGGQCTMDVLDDINQTDYGNGSQYTINTNSPFTVRTDFHESGGDFTGYTSTLTQDGRSIVLTTGTCNYLNNMTEDMKRMVIVMSNWGSGSLNWLQHGVCSGSCS